MGREGTRVHGVRVMFTAYRDLKQTKFMFLCSVLCLILYVTDGMCTVCTQLGSVTQRRVSFYTSFVGGGLRLSGSSSGSNGSVRVYRSCM